MDRTLKILRNEQQKKLEKLETEIILGEEALQKINGQIDERRENIATLDLNFEQLSKDLNQVGIPVEHKQEKDILESQIQELKEAVTSIKKVYEERDRKNEKLISDLRAKLASSTSVIRMLEEKAKKLETKNQDLNQNKEELLGINNELTKQKENYEALLQELKVANSDISEENSQLIKEKNKLAEEKDILAEEKNTLNKEVIELKAEQEAFKTSEEKIVNLEELEFEEDEDNSVKHELVDGAFPWNKYIDQHDEENLDSIDLDHFAKEEPKQLSKKQLTELRSLHGDLREAEKDLEKYIKKPPPGRADMERELAYIRDAIVDLLQGAGVRRVEIDKYIYSIRKIATYFRVTSEAKAISVLKKRKLGRFIKTIETLSMSDLRKYLIEKDIIIPGLKKIDKDTSIYIYEKHGENIELISVLHPEGLTEELIDEFAAKTMAIVGSREMTSEMYDAVGYQTKKALDAGWNIVTGGAKGTDERVIKEVLSHNAAKKLTVYLPKTIEHQPVRVRGLLQRARSQGAKIIENAGADRVARIMKKFTRETAPYVKSAFERNKLIVKDADAMVAIQKGRSGGTQHSIKTALEKGIPVKRVDEKLNAFLLKTILKKLHVKSLGNLTKFIKGVGKILPGLAPILDAIDLGILWKNLDNLENDIAAGTANEDQKRIWKWLQQEKKASEDWVAKFEEDDGIDEEELEEEFEEFEEEIEEEFKKLEEELDEALDENELEEKFMEDELEDASEEADLEEAEFSETDELIELEFDEGSFTEGIQKMAIVGETSPSSGMLKAARYQTKKALGRGWGITASGASGIGKEVIEETLDVIGKPKFQMFPPLKNAAIDQLNKTKVAYVVDDFVSGVDKVTVSGVGPAKVTKIGSVSNEILKKHLKASGYDSVRSWDYDVRQPKGGSARWKTMYKLETLPKTKKLTIFLKNTVKDQSGEIQHLLSKARTSGVRIFENAPTGQSIDVADAVITIQKRGAVTDTIKHALKRNKEVLLIDEKLKSILLRKSGTKILVKNLGSLVGKVLKGIGGVVPGITILIDAIEIGRLWKDIDTLPEALEKGTMNEDQKKIYEALLRKREASEDTDEFAELKKMAILGQISVTPGMLKAARFQAHQAVGSGWGVITNGVTGMHAEVIEETLKTMATKGRAMQFSVPEVREHLNTHGTVYTQRAYDLPDERVIAGGAGPGKRTKIGEVTDDLLKKHVGKSGFKTLKEWETAKLKFGPAKRMWLYKVELLPKSDKLTIYLSTKIADQTGTARKLLDKARTYGARIIENAPAGKVVKDANAVIIIKAGHSVPKVAAAALGHGKPVRMINESLKKFSVIKSGSKILVEQAGSLVGKVLKGVGKIMPGISFLIDAIELGRLWKDIDTLPEALEKDSLNENQKKIYEALQRKREASEDTEEIDLEVEKDKGLEWHLIPRDQRLGDIRETIDDLEPRKSDPFPEPIVEFVKKKNEEGLSIEEIDEALVKMIKDGELPTWKMYISDSERYIFTEDNSENLYPGLYLVEPHSELIWTGAKTAIVKSKKFTEHINEPLYLISDKQCYGIIKLSEPEEIDKEEFDERYEEHLVENFERKEWWKNKLPLYLYEVEIVEKFEPVRDVEIPVGIQVFIGPTNIKFK